MKSINIFSKIDKPLLIMSIIYSIIGAVMVLSASSISAVLQYGEAPYYFFVRQIIFIAVSYFIGFFVILRTPVKRYKRYLPLALLGVLGLLVYLLLFGDVMNGAKSWINLGLFTIQPSEFAKTILIVYMGVFYGDLLNTNRQTSKYAFFIPLIYSIIVFMLVVLQPDLGNALIIAGIVFLVFMSIPFKKDQVIRALKLVAGALAVVGIVFILSGAPFLTEMQRERLTFKEPCTRYTDDTGYQVCNGFIAMHNGGLFGKGFGNSTQKYMYLPEAYNDMIFPIVVEELGLIVAVLIIIGYMFILYRIIKIAKNSLLVRNSIICYGVAVYMFLHLVINFCGILALIPLTGVPVPFLSYGGSFIMNMIFCIFIVERICAENKISKTKLEISKM